MSHQRKEPEYGDAIQSSGGTSESESRGPPARFQPITQDDNEDEAQRAGTTRRNRPPAISTSTGSMYSARNAQSSTSESQHTPTQDSSRQRNLASSSRQRTYSPEPITPANKPKKPAISRRASSKFQAPHKGQEFSVDDDPIEYESDVVQRRTSTAHAASGLGPSLKRQPSTLRRRPTAQPTSLPRMESQGEEEEEAEQQPKQLPSLEAEESHDTSGEDTVQADADDEDEDEDDETSDAESFTLKDRQQAINETHPFGIRIWKPALYKKNRSVEKTAEGDIHSSPGGRVNQWLRMFNVLWTVLFGWWLFIVALLGALICRALGFMPGALNYGQVFWGLSWYLLYPFGKFVKLEQDEAYADEDEGEGRSITEYEQWQSGDLEDGRLFFGPLTSRPLIGRRRASMESADEFDSLLGRTSRGAGSDPDGARAKRRFFGRGEWNAGRVIYFIYFYFLITPLLLLASGICWFLVFWIPMGKVTLLLFYHLRRHPLAMSFHSDTAYSRGPSSPSSSILLCTYRAVGLKYWKYTIDGTNIFLINLIGVVLFAIFDYWVLGVALGLDSWLVHPGFVFALALFSIIPLAYFIGQAVASISAQSSMGVGAAINAFFSTVVEVFLYCVALAQGKGQLVEGSIIGSIFAGILFLPGLSMCFGALKRKTQRFNVRSAGVTSTMLLFATIAAFGPTLFYQIYGSHELNCHSCIISNHGETDSDCRRCYFSQVPAINDQFFIRAVRPYCWFAAVLLFLSYIIGLWFTLRTHAAVIWNSEIDEKKAQPQPGMNGSITQHHPSQSVHASNAKKHSDSSKGTIGRNEIRDSQLYKRILGQSLNQVGMGFQLIDESRHVSTSGQAPHGQSPRTPHLVPPKSSGGDESTAVDAASQMNVHISGLSEEENAHLVRQVAEMAATAATVATRDAMKAPRKASAMSYASAHHTPRASAIAFPGHEDATVAEGAGGHAESGGHDAPNWSRLKSSIILLGATVLYAIIAEILVNTVDVVLESVDIDEKFLGITLFALVPNTTEFLNAISFAMNGNIALSMEIGSAYALQVCLLQIPALVLFSAVYGQHLDPQDLIDHTFNLIFPQWDMVTVILCVFLLSYVYGEGKSNYFKGSILVLAYLVIIMGFYASGFSSNMNIMGVDQFDTLALRKQSFKTIGRSSRGVAY
ncbi:MAG: hypothetical protein LQ343_004713 [Gyalolechia ehrenbergii]|nr:MAG: hypothetical protein LQ343_004713 [Gyalolechia ehrenbergii]